MSVLLVELGTEELPPKALPAMAGDFERLLCAALADARLPAGTSERFATPRRLAVLVHDVGERQPDREVEKRGPPVKIAFDADGTPTRAAAAFAKGCGVAVTDLERVSTPKGDWLVHRSVEHGLAAADVVADLLADVVDAIPVPRRMRWGNGDASFSRPVRWVVAMLDDLVIDCEILGCRSGDVTMGHRFHGPRGGVRLAHASHYPQALADAHVVAAFDVRREAVREGILATAAQAGATAIVDEALLDEVTALVERPVPVLAGFDERFLALPSEVIIATLQEHQRYFPLSIKDSLTNKFITVANIASRQPERVRQGNERVVQPRLADAAFFWEADGRRTLESRRVDLARVVFQAKLGTLADKTARLEKLTAAFCDQLRLAPAEAVLAARLAKTDLLTDMVGEFPELQGVMGRHYALRDGEPAAVATALEEQYLPRFAGDRLPHTPAGQALACADRLDTMAGCFAIGARPTGNKDPFGLRRSGLGILRILIEGELDVDLRALLHQAAALQPVLPEGGATAVAEDVEDFLMERLRGYYQEATGREAHEHAGSTASASGAGAMPPALEQSVFDAVLAVRPARPLDFDRRLRAVRAFVRLDAAQALAAANKRISNILRQAGVTGAGQSAASPPAPATSPAVGAGPAGAIDPDLLQAPAEKALHAAVDALRQDVGEALAAGRYTEALNRLAGLREAVDRFFDEVMVMAEDERLRRNRLALLADLRELFTRTADISLLQHG